MHLCTAPDRLAASCRGTASKTPPILRSRLAREHAWRPPCWLTGVHVSYFSPRLAEAWPSTPDRWLRGGTQRWKDFSHKHYSNAKYRDAVSTIYLTTLYHRTMCFANPVRPSWRGLAKFEACHWACTRRVLCPPMLDFTGSVRF